MWLSEQEIYNKCSLQNSGAINVGNKIPRRFQNFSVCLGKTSAKKPAKYSAETFAYYVGNGFAIPRHFAKSYDLFFLRLLVLPKLYYLLITHLNKQGLIYN